jgi:protein-disulfide isomerase
LFANWSGEGTFAFEDAALKNYAAAIDLDSETFDECLDSGQFATQVQADTAGGAGRGVQSTPTFFINGEMIRGLVPYEEFRRQIEASLAG